MWTIAHMFMEVEQHRVYQARFGHCPHAQPAYKHWICLSFPISVLFKKCQAVMPLNKAEVRKINRETIKTKPDIITPTPPHPRPSDRLGSLPLLNGGCGSASTSKSAWAARRSAHRLRV